MKKLKKGEYYAIPGAFTKEELKKLFMANRNEPFYSYNQEDISFSLEKVDIYPSEKTSRTVLTILIFNDDVIDYYIVDKRLTSKEFIQIDPLDCYLKFMMNYCNGSSNKNTIEGNYKKALASNELLECQHRELITGIKYFIERNVSKSLKSWKEPFLNSACEAYKEPSKYNFISLIAAISLYPYTR